MGEVKRCAHKWERFGSGAFLCQQCDATKNSRCNECDGPLGYRRRGESMCVKCTRLNKQEAGSHE